MPWLPKHTCHAPGCTVLVGHEKRRCAQHEREHWEQMRQGGNRPSASQRGLGARWRRLRAVILSRDPLCKIAVHCDGDAVSVEVDHILARSKGGALYDPDNLQGACHRCHAWKTKQDMRRDAGR